MRHFTAAGTYTDNTIMDANGVFLPDYKSAGRTVNFATATGGTLAINEATYYGRFTMFPFSFTASTSIPAYTNLAMINGTKYRPAADTNLYIVGGLAGQPKLMTMQVLKNGAIRCNQALTSGQTVVVELFWISSFFD